MYLTKREDDWQAFGRSRAVVKELGLINALLYGLNRVLVRPRTSIRIFRYYLFAQPVPAADVRRLGSTIRRPGPRASKSVRIALARRIV